jgi:hypothetical protein
MDYRRYQENKLDEAIRNVQKATVTISATPNGGDPTGVREKGLTGAERIQVLTNEFVGVAKAYGMNDADIDLSVPGEITLNRPTKDALVAAKYLSYTKLSPYIASL